MLGDRLGVSGAFWTVAFITWALFLSRRPSIQERVQHQTTAEMVQDRGGVKPMRADDDWSTCGLTRNVCALSDRHALRNVLRSTLPAGYSSPRPLFSWNSRHTVLYLFISSLSRSRWLSLACNAHACSPITQLQRNSVPHSISFIDDTYQTTGHCFLSIFNG